MMKWITAADIKGWVTTNSPDCSQSLPELIWRLIYATATSIEKINFPSGTSSTTSGWDGKLETVAAWPYFPQGVSGWEMGVEESAKTKANRDYLKRTGDSLELPMAETTFVFVTPRSWPKREEWAMEKRAEVKWKDVRVIGADDLEQWLAMAPAVALWLAKKLKKVTEGFQDIEKVWEEWSLGTTPPMLPEVVICGRTKNIEKIQQWIIGDPNVLEIKGDSPTEPFAFLYAAIHNLPEAHKSKALSRCIKVEGISQLRWCVDTFSQPLIIAVPAECLEIAYWAKSKGHHIFLSMDAETIDHDGRVLNLARPLVGALEQALRNNGFSEADAHRHAKDSGCSIPVLRRILSSSSAVRTPVWAKLESAPVLLPALLAGAWADDKQGDRELLESLSGKTYEIFTRELQALVVIDDSPIRHVGNIWMIKSPLDAWFLIARHLDTEYLRRFQQSINAVLTETNPKYDLTPEKRWAAAIYGKTARYSEWLRKGLVESLVLLAVYGDKVTTTVTSQDFVDTVLTEILTAASTWQAWSSLKDVTPLLAEATPEAFMKILEGKLENDPDLFKGLMKDEEGVFGECKHSGLLWALESISWRPDYFVQAVKILISLAKIDPGGSWNNRPLNSLRDLFLVGLPQTYASPSRRLEAFDLLANQEPDLFWKASQSFMSGSVSPSYQFQWRPSGGERDCLQMESNKDSTEYVEDLVPRLAKLACATMSNLISALSEFINIHADIKKQVLESLKALDPSNLSKNDRDNLLTNLRDKLNWINSYGQNEIRAYISPLQQALDRLTPDNVIDRVGWILSDPWPHLPEGEPEDFDSREKIIMQKRTEAALELLDKASFQEIFDYSRSIEYPGVLGSSIGMVIRNGNEDNLILDSMLQQKPLNTWFIVGYVQGRISIKGSDWVANQINRLKQNETFFPEAGALICLGLPSSASTWSMVSSYGTETEQAYWKRSNGYSTEPMDATIAVEKLLNAERVESALNVAGSSKVSIPSALLQRLLDALILFNPERPVSRNMFGYYVGGIFKQLYERNELSLEEIAKLEWPFAKVFEEIQSRTNTPLAIHKVLQKSPSFFVQLVSFKFHRDDMSTDPSMETLTELQKKNMWENATNVLNSWHLVPGFNADRSIDEKALKDWIESARKQCAEIFRVTGGDLAISEMLSHAPADNDGAWPHKIIRDLIEGLQNKIIEKHIPIAIFNNRGVVSRAIFEGGEQERELAGKYENMSKIVNLKWPRTAAMLRAMASRYERNAKSEDLSSELDNLQY